MFLNFGNILKIMLSWKQE